MELSAETTERQGERGSDSLMILFMVFHALVHTFLMLRVRDGPVCVLQEINVATFLSRRIRYAKKSLDLCPEKPRWTGCAA